MQGNEKWGKMPFPEQGVIDLDSPWWYWVGVGVRERLLAQFALPHPSTLSAAMREPPQKLSDDCIIPWPPAFFTAQEEKIQTAYWGTWSPLY